MHERNIYIMNYVPKMYRGSIPNPAGNNSRIFLYKNSSEEKILSSHCMYFEVDTETSAKPDDEKDCQAVAFSLAPKMAEQSYAICSTIYTDQRTTFIELLDTLQKFGCESKEIYAYFHNLNYDGIFLLNFLIKDMEFTQELKKLTAKSAEYNENKFGILHNNGLLEARVIWKGKCIIFRDSFRLWDASIDEISKELIKINKESLKNNVSAPFPLVLEKSDLNFDYDKIRKPGEKITEEEIKYMLNDVNAGVCILKMFEVFATLGVSASGMAYNLCVDSFQNGILSCNVIKYMLKNDIDRILKEDELHRYIKCVADETYTYIFCKAYDTIDFGGLTEKSDEYITKFKNHYTKQQNRNTAVTRVSILSKTEEVNIKKVIKSGLKNLNLSDFEIFQELKENIVFMQYYMEFGGMLKDVIHDFLHLKSEKDIAAIEALHQINKKDRYAKSFDEYYQIAFPKLTKTQDDMLRHAYRGGISNAVDLYSNIEQHNIISIDINSSYPKQMAECRLPYGQPIDFIRGENGKFQHFEEEGKERKLVYELTFEEITAKWDLYIVKFQAGYKLKYPCVPMVPYKSQYNVARYRHSDTKERQIEANDFLYMTNVEFDLFCKTHEIDIDNVYIDEVQAFESAEKIFKKFVSRLYKIKSKYKGTSMYAPVKTMLNSVYGRFAMNRFKFTASDTFVRLDNKEILTFKKEDSGRDIKRMTIGSYLPTAIFTTSYARCQLIETANTINAAGGHACYFDTDSIHFSADSAKIENNELVINDIYTGIPAGNRLGAWKVEVCRNIDSSGNITGVESGTYICSKRYIETDTDGFKNIRCSGVPKSQQMKMTAEDLRLGKEITSTSKHRTKSGVKITSVEKHIELSTNVYKTENGTVCNDDVYDIGEDITDMYGREVTVQEVVYKMKCKPRYDLI